MKQIQILAFSFLIVCCVQCKKSSNATDVPGLPPATQVGANTFGCLVNGVVFKPTTRNDLSLDLDLGFNNGIMGIVAYMIVDANNSSMIVIGVTDSLRTYPPPRIYKINGKDMGFISYSKRNFCTMESYDGVTISNGSLSISKLDLNNQIVSGTYEVTLVNKLCTDTVRITNGRFDIKF